MECIITVINGNRLDAGSVGLGVSCHLRRRPAGREVRGVLMIYHGDCLDIMPTLADKSVDMILCDLPYGTTACKWDTVIPFEPLWKQYKRLIKDNGAIVLTASQPFTSALVMSNIKWFKHEWIWDKVLSTGHLNAKRMPMRQTENIVVFYEGICTYNPILIKRPEGKRINKGTGKIEGLNDSAYGIRKSSSGEYDYRQPTTLLTISNADRTNRLHPTQKPVALFEYLIRTYTNEGDTVLDNCAGSFTTAIACLNTNRKYICIEKDEKYFDIGKNRIANHQPLLQAVNV